MSPSLAHGMGDLSRYLTPATEAAVGAALGGGAGYLSEKKDEKTGKRRVGARTLVGGAGGTLGGLLTGGVLRNKRYYGSLSPDDYQVYFRARREGFDPDDARAGMLESSLWRKLSDIRGRVGYNPPSRSQLSDDLRILNNLKRSINEDKLKFAPFGIGLPSLDKKLSRVEESLKQGKKPPFDTTKEAGGALGGNDCHPSARSTKMASISGQIKAQLAEHAAGGALGAAAGYASEKKDPVTGKRKVGLRTLSGGAIGAVAGGVGGHARRMNKAGLPFNPPEFVTDPAQVRAINAMDDGFYPFGIGFKGVKEASLAEYSVLFDAIDSGALGSHVKEALIGVCEGMSSSLQSLHAKIASSPVHTEEEARQARLNQLLRKF